VETEGRTRIRGVALRAAPPGGTPGPSAEIHSSFHHLRPLRSGLGATRDQGSSQAKGLA